MAKKLSELLSELSQKVQQLEEEFSLASSKSTKELEAWAKNLKLSIDQETKEFDDIAEDWRDDLKSDWNKVRNDLDQGVTNIKAKALHLAKDLQSEYLHAYADTLEKYAELSVSYAIKAVNNASDSILMAVNARKKADEVNNV